MRTGPDFASLRAEMVERQLRRRGDLRRACAHGDGRVPRELFVPERLRRRAYADSALPIGEGQTISQPWIVAAICQALRLEGGERVLEVGTGRATRPPCSRCWHARCSGSSCSRSWPQAPGGRWPRSEPATWSWSSATAAAAFPSGRRSTLSPFTPPRRRRPAPCSSSSSRAAVSWPRSPSARPTC